MLYPLALNETGYSSVNIDNKKNADKSKMVKQCNFILNNSESQTTCIAGGLRKAPKRG
jgi:hypothetical protein